MIALEELPERDKDSLRPIFPLKRWLSTKTVDKAFDRIEKAYGSRSAFLVQPALPLPGDQSDIANELRALGNPADGFRNWCDLFTAGRALHHTPSLQLTDAVQFDLQASRLLALGRGAIVVLNRQAFQFATPIAARVAAHVAGGAGVVFLLDFGKQGHTLLVQDLVVSQLCDTIFASCPNAYVAVSASSFPDSFGVTEGQEIYERLLFQSLRARFGASFVYSDRGSARAEKPGGGGVPYPRVDYPLATQWRFFRTDAPAPYKGGYKELAGDLMKSEGVWDPNIRIWGTQMIEKTQLGESSGISSPARATAVRINLHLHRQLWFDDPIRLYDTEDDWTDG